jgi:RNA polymerase sigma-70 factor (ECF subfamily)
MCENRVFRARPIRARSGSDGPGRRDQGNVAADPSAAADRPWRTKWCHTASEPPAAARPRGARAATPRRPSAAAEADATTARGPAVESTRQNVRCGVIMSERVAAREESTVARPGQCADMTPSLVARLRAGDNRAGVLLDQLYRKPMLRFCWGYLGRTEDTEDVVQEIFCKALASADVPDNFRAWLYRIARNVCINALRSRGRRRDALMLASDSRLAGDTTGNLTRLVKAEFRSRIGHLLAALPTEQREALRLRYVEGLSRAEIAYVLELPEATVKARLFEGLKKLREHTSLLDDH